MTEYICIPIGELHRLRVDAHAFRLLRDTGRLGDLLCALFNQEEVTALADQNTAIDKAVTYRRRHSPDDRRAKYTTPALSPLQIKAVAEASWARYDALIAPRRAAA